MGEELQKLDKAFLVLLICERIKSFLQGGGNLGELAFVSAFWREFAAAVILYLLEQTDRTICISKVSLLGVDEREKIAQNKSRRIVYQRAIRQPDAQTI